MMRWNSLLLPVSLIGGIALAAALITATGGGRADTAAEAHAVVSGPVECGSHVTIDVYLDSIDARTSDLGQPVGLGAYNVALHYPNDALRPADRDATRVVLPDGAPTVDGAAARQWIPGPPYSDLVTGELWFGAFSYNGSLNPSKAIGEIEVADRMEERERGGVAIAKRAPLLLGTFGLVTGKPGTHVAELTLTAVDSSMAALEYANDTIDIPVDVKDGPCAKFAEVEPPPTHPPTMPPWEGWDKIPTPDPFPDDITPTAGEFADLGDACETGRPYHIATRGIDLCLPTGWSVTHDPTQADVDAAQIVTPMSGWNAGPQLYTRFERLSADGKQLADMNVTIFGSEPFSLTGCGSPAIVPGIGTICVHELTGKGPRGVSDTWRLIGITTGASQWVTIGVSHTGDDEEMNSVQRESLQIVKSMRGGR